MNPVHIQLVARRRGIGADHAVPIQERLRQWILVLGDRAEAVAVGGVATHLVDLFEFDVYTHRVVVLLATFVYRRQARVRQATRAYICPLGLVLQILNVLLPFLHHVLVLLYLINAIQRLIVVQGDHAPLAGVRAEEVVRLHVVRGEVVPVVVERGDVEGLLLGFQLRPHNYRLARHGTLSRLHSSSLCRHAHLRIAADLSVMVTRRLVQLDLRFLRHLLCQFVLDLLVC